MALGNFLKNGTYATVSTGIYEPQSARKLISVNLMVWEDSDKAKICAHFSFVRQGTDTDGADYIADWDDYFAPSVMDAAGNNLQKICYEYLKSLPYFSGCTDV